MKSLTGAWITLVVLTGLTMVARSAAAPHIANSLILGLAGIKAALVTVIFMEGRRAHQWWRFLVLGLLAGLLGTITLMGSRS